MNKFLGVLLALLCPVLTHAGIGDGRMGPVSVQSVINCAGSSLNIDAGTLYIDCTNNRVGLGTTSPSAAVHSSVNGMFSGALNRFGQAAASVSAALNSEQLGVYRDGQAGFSVSSIADSSLFTLLSARTSHASKSAVTTGDAIGVIAFKGYVGATGYINAAQIGGDVTGTVSDASNGLGVNVVFKTRESGANLLTRMTVQSDGAVVMGDQSNGPTTISTFTSNGYFSIQRATETIGAGATITADNCGGVKAMSAGGAVTTSTTLTFTACNAALKGCSMTLINVGANNITLDNNVNFKSAGGADVVVTPDDVVNVYCTGAQWYQTTALLAN